MIEKKYKRLQSILQEMKSVLVAFSGGVDSTFLLAVAKRVLGDAVLAVTARSESYPLSEFKESQKLAHCIGATQMVIHTSELAIPHFSKNPANRCFYCKHELFSRLQKIASEKGYDVVLDGSNHDDLGDYRPGMVASQKLGVRSPLREAKLTKNDIRLLSKKLNLPTWNKPAFACLASRFPYGNKITRRALRMVEKAEQVLHEAGARQVRVRHHGALARIEVPPAEIPRFLSPAIREAVVRALKRIGYTYVTIDAEGYRTGSMNETLKKRKRSKAL